MWMMRRQNQIEDNECHRDIIAQCTKKTKLYIKRMNIFTLSSRTIIFNDFCFKISLLTK